MRLYLLQAVRQERYGNLRQNIILRVCMDTHIRRTSRPLLHIAGVRFLRRTCGHSLPAAVVKADKTRPLPRKRHNRITFDKIALMLRNTLFCSTATLGDTYLRN